LKTLNNYCVTEIQSAKPICLASLKRSARDQMS